MSKSAPSDLSHINLLDPKDVRRQFSFHFLDFVSECCNMFRVLLLMLSNLKPQWYAPFCWIILYFFSAFWSCCYQCVGYVVNWLKFYFVNANWFESQILLHIVLGWQVCFDRRMPIKFLLSPAFHQKVVSLFSFLPVVDLFFQWF